ncbi:ankyrin repeat, partial [Elysia marginata]
MSRDAMAAAKPRAHAASTSSRRKKEDDDNADELVGDLFDAISDGNAKHVAFILKEAKKVHTLLNKKDLQGLTPLRKAIALSKAEIARLLVQHGASPNARDPQGLTPLRKAIALSKAEIARLLVQHGASPNARDPLGKTPLHTAVMMGRRELLAPLLVSVDSSVNVQDK